MTGIYLRVQRDGKWQNIEVEYLTDEERMEFFKEWSTEEIMRCFNLVCNTLENFEFGPVQIEDSELDGEY